MVHPGTTTGNLSARVKKLQGLPVVPKLLAAGIRCEAWGWFKRGERWDVRRVELKGDDCEAVRTDAATTGRPANGASGAFRLSCSDSPAP